MLCTATPDISSSSKNINSTAGVSRLSSRYLWLWLVFIDSFQFLDSSLDSLVEKLGKDDFK